MFKGCILIVDEARRARIQASRDRVLRINKDKQRALGRYNINVRNTVHGSSDEPSIILTRSTK